MSRLQVHKSEKLTDELRNCTLHNCRLSSTRVRKNAVYIREDTVEQPARLGFAISVLISTKCPHLVLRDD